MLSENGGIGFVDEIIKAVDAFLAEYEATQGPCRNALERGLVVSYVLGVMHCQLDAVWNVLGESPVFGTLHPRTVFQECIVRDEQVLKALRQEILAKLSQRAWFSGEDSQS